MALNVTPKIYGFKRDNINSYILEQYERFENHDTYVRHDTLQKINTIH